MPIPHRCDVGFVEIITEPALAAFGGTDMKKTTGSRGVVLGPGSSGNRIFGGTIVGFDTGIEDNGARNSFYDTTVIGAEVAMALNGHGATVTNLLAMDHFRYAIRRAHRDAVVAALQTRLNKADADIAAQVFDDLKTADTGAAGTIEKIEANPLYRAANIVSVATSLVQVVLGLSG